MTSGAAAPPGERGATSADRVPRTLAIGQPLSSLLSTLAIKAGRPPSGHVDLDALFAIEVALGFHFSDDILAAFAVELPSLRASHRFGLADVVGHSGRLRDAAWRGDLMGLATDGDTEFVLDKRTARPNELTRVSCIDVGSRGAVVETLSLSSFLCRIAGISESESQDASPPFAATLHRKSAMASAPGRVVVHKKFGRGTAFNERGDGPTRQVKCDFPGVGLKVIQARFLEFDDDSER